MTNLAKIMLIALTLGAFGIYLTSCSQSEILETTTENTAEQLSGEFKLSEHGWLHFENEAALDAAKKEVFQYMRDGNLDEFDKKYGYKSLNTAYWETMENLTDDEKIAMGTQRQVFDEYKDIFTFVGEGEDTEAVRIIESDLLATLLNHRGVYQIGDEIHKYDYDVVKIIKDGDVDKLNNIEQINSSDANMGIEVKSHNKNRRFTQDNDDELNMRLPACENLGTYTANSSKKKARRVQGRVTFEEVGFVDGYSIYVTIRSVKQRQFVVWYDNNWNGWLRTRSWDLRSWYKPFAPGAVDEFFAPGLTDTGETWGVISRSAHSFQFVGNVDDDGVAYLNIDYNAMFQGYWTGWGGRTYTSYASNDLHTIACFR